MRLCSTLICHCWSLQQLLFPPACPEIRTVLRLSGASSELERTLSSVRWDMDAHVCLRVHACVGRSSGTLVCLTLHDLLTQRFVQPPVLLLFSRSTFLPFSFPLLFLLPVFPILEPFTNTLQRNPKSVSAIWCLLMLRTCTFFHEVGGGRASVRARVRMRSRACACM